jgi:RNA polymerase sigma factor (sigma-70 family)
MAKGTQQQSAKAAAKKRVVKVDTHGDVHVTASFNNIIVVYTNKQGQVITSQEIEISKLKELVQVKDKQIDILQRDIAAYIAKEKLFELIRNLPDGYRLVFNLYAIEKYSHKQIAEALNIEEGTSKSQLFKARKMLQKEIIKLQQYINH